MKHQRQIIDTFVNSGYVFDDRVVLNFNFTDDAKTVTREEVLGSSPVPSTTSPDHSVRGFFVVGGTGREQHGHAAGVANNSPVGCCLVRGFQRPGMSTKKAPPAGAPFAPPQLGGTGQEQCKSEPFVKKQRQGIIVAMVSCLFRIWDGLSVNGMVYSAQQIGSYMWRRIIMNTVRMILCGNVEDSRMNPSEKVGVVSVVFVSTEEEKIKNKLKKLQDKNPEKFYMEYVTPLDVDLTSLEHYPSIEISKNDLQ